MISRPVIVYLDTQDYIRLFNETDGGPAHGILDQILAFRDRGEITICYSWVIMLEFITRPTDEFREERIRRGQLVKEICGPNAFPYITELKHGVRFPNNGMWFSRCGRKPITAERFRHQKKNNILEPSRNRGASTEPSADDLIDHQKCVGYSVKMI